MNRQYTEREVKDFHGKMYDLVDGVCSIPTAVVDAMMQQHPHLWVQLEVSRQLKVVGDKMGFSFDE